MSWNRTHSVIATVAYADLFDYPLTRHEVHHWLISKKVTNLTQHTVSTSEFSIQENFVALNDIQKKIALRKKREEASNAKWKRVRRLPSFFLFIPTLELVGVSGGLTMNNADPQDDIDLFIVVRPHTIWISRLMILTLFQLLGKRRKFRDTIETNTWCTNMFMVSTHMALPVNERDLYAAHEILQMVPIFERNNTYTEFLNDNNWVSGYLSNAWNEKTSSSAKASEDKEHRKRKTENNMFLLIVEFIIMFPFIMLDFPAKYLQLWYMKPHRTTEVISDTVLRFHPHDMRRYIQKRYVRLLKKYKVPLDSPFLNSLQ